MHTRKLMRLRIIRLILILTIAANITVAVKVLPAQFLKGELSTSSLGELGRAYEERVHTGRGVCILFYDTYAAPNLAITKDAHQFWGLDLSIYYRFCRASKVTILGNDEVPVDLLSDKALEDEMHFGLPNALRTARFLAADGTVDTVYAVLEDEVIYFVPVGVQNER